MVSGGVVVGGSSVTAGFHLGAENKSLRSGEDVVTVSGTSRLLLEGAMGTPGEPAE